MTLIGRRFRLVRPMEQVDPLLRYFDYGHLPENLQPMSRLFAELAHALVQLAPRCAERTVALRKLLEGKDAAVRAMLPVPWAERASGPVGVEHSELISRGEGHGQ